MSVAYPICDSAMRAVQALTKLGLTPCCGLLKASKGSTGAHVN